MSAYNFMVKSLLYSILNTKVPVPDIFENKKDLSTFPPTATCKKLIPKICHRIPTNLITNHQL